MRLALLTGVGREGQVGESVARRLSADGFEVVLVDRDAPSVEARAAALRAGGGKAHAYTADLSDPAGVDTLVETVTAKHGMEFDALVHLAGGFAITGPVAETKVDEWDRQLTINLRTTFLMSRGMVPLLRARRGSIVFFSSESALTGAKVARLSAYAVAKSGVVVLAVAISQEEAESGVRANVLAPASIRTATNVAAMPAGSRFVEREDVAATVSWLCSDASAAVTGQVIRLAPRK